MSPEHAWYLFETMSLMCRMKMFRKWSGKRVLLCASVLQPGLRPCSASWVPLHIQALFRLRDALLEPSEAQLPVVELHANRLQLLRPHPPECSQTGLQSIVRNVIVRIRKNSSEFVRFNKILKILTNSYKFCFSSQASYH